MKIKELRLSNYKKFNSQTFNFCDESGNPHDMLLIVGNNGTGKSSILQAIAMLVGAAAKPFTAPSDLEYPGFKWDNIQRGRMPVDVRATLQFNDEEIRTTQQFSSELAERYPDKIFVPPGNNREIELRLDYVENAVKAEGNASAFFQTKGYQYALQLSKFERNFDRLFQQVGSIYTYHEQRTATSIHSSGLSRDANGNGDSNTVVVDENLVKEVLFKWFVFHDRTGRRRGFELREGQRDFFAELERRYQMLFRGRSFKGFAPQMSPDQFFDTEQDFWLFDGVNDYEFSEMSGGERAIFPMLIDFANRNINNSIIIIDEVELHLHPPLQQALIRALPLLGSNNQFILTTHSDDVATLFSESQIIRLPNE